MQHYLKTFSKFTADPIPVHPTNNHDVTTYTTQSQGVPDSDEHCVPIINSQDANTTTGMDPPPPSVHSFRPDDIITTLTTPHTIADHPFSSPSPINAPPSQANFVHYFKAIQGPDFQHWQDSLNADSSEIIRLFITTITAKYRPDLLSATLIQSSKRKRTRSTQQKSTGALD